MEPGDAKTKLKIGHAPDDGKCTKRKHRQPCGVAVLELLKMRRMPGHHLCAADASLVAGAAEAAGSGGASGLTERR